MILKTTTTTIVVGTLLSVLSVFILGHKIAKNNEKEKFYHVKLKFKDKKEAQEALYLYKIYKKSKLRSEPLAKDTIKESLWDKKKTIERPIKKLSDIEVKQKKLSDIEKEIKQLKQEMKNKKTNHQVEFL